MSGSWCRLVVLPRGRAQWLGVSLASLTACTSIATPLAADTLREALLATYETNPKLDAERARLRATDESVPQAKAGYRPSAALNADAGRQRTLTDPTSSGDGTTTAWGYNVTVQQNLFHGYRTVNSVREAESDVRAGRENLRNIRVKHHNIAPARKPGGIFATHSAAEIIFVQHLVIAFVIHFLLHISSFRLASPDAH